MANCKVIAVANQKGGVGKSTSVYCIGAGLALDGKRVLLVDVDPQGDLTKMLGQRKPHELPHTLAEQMNAVVQHSAEPEHPEILHHHEGFDFVPANRSLSAVEVGLVNVMSRETVLKRYLDGIADCVFECHLYFFVGKKNAPLFGCAFRCLFLLSPISNPNSIYSHARIQISSSAVRGISINTRCRNLQ